MNYNYIHWTGDVVNPSGTSVPPNYGDWVHRTPFRPMESIPVSPFNQHKSYPFIPNHTDRIFIPNTELNTPIKMIVHTEVKSDGTLELIYRETKRPLTQPHPDDKFYKEIYHVADNSITLKEVVEGRYVPPKDSSYEFD